MTVDSAVHPKKRFEDAVVLGVVSAAYHKAFSVGPLELADLSVEDIRFVAGRNGVRLGKSIILAALKRLAFDCKVSRCRCCDRWRFVSEDALAQLAKGSA